MKRKLLVGLLLIPGTGCASMSNTDRGVLGGGALGAATGAIIGSAVGHTGAGAAIGAGLGGVTGGLLGASEDRAEARADAQAAAAAQAQAARQLSLTDIVNMKRGGISDPVIVNQIRSTNSVFNLTPDQLAWLHQYGVSDYVITEMQTRRPVQVVYPSPYVRPAVIYVEPPPPPVGVAVGIGFRR